MKEKNLTILYFPTTSIADSPLLQVPGGTKKTERRRSRSRNRQEIESELARKVNEIPMVHDTIEYLLSTYSLIKASTQVDTGILIKLPREIQDLKLYIEMMPAESKLRIFSNCLT